MPLRCSCLFHVDWHSYHSSKVGMRKKMTAVQLTWALISDVTSSASVSGHQSQIFQVVISFTAAASVSPPGGVDPAAVVHTGSYPLFAPLGHVPAKSKAAYGGVRGFKLLFLLKPPDLPLPSPLVIVHAFLVQPFRGGWGRIRLTCIILVLQKEKMNLHCKHTHAYYLDVSPTEFNGTYSKVCMCRIAALIIFAWLHYYSTAWFLLEKEKHLWKQQFPNCWFKLSVQHPLGHRSPSLGLAVYLLCK